ncbi:hypothetical protein HPGCJGGD_2016 [Methylobacterium haplocladii]|nr:hypothetical protein HPGCJGGD_2016 [Methylobacterium haplocladii]
MTSRLVSELPLGHLGLLPSNRAGWYEFGSAKSIEMPSPSFLGGAGGLELLTRFAGRPMTMPAHGCAVLTDAYAYGDGLAFVDDHLLLDSSVTASPIDIGAWGFFRDVGPLHDGKRRIDNWSEHPHRLGEAVLLARRSDFVYGHWLLETLPRVRLAQRLCSDQAAFIVSASIAEYQIEMLEQLGIARSRLFPLNPGIAVHCDRLIVPSLAHWSSNVVHDFACETYDALITDCIARAGHGRAHDRILVTRSSRKRDPRPLFNLADVEVVARRHGFVTVDPGAVPWWEQIAIFAQASAVVGQSGSGLHNTVYTGERGHVLVLQPNHSRNFLQTSIAAIRRHRISYLFGESFSAFDREGSECGYVIDVDLLDQTLSTII